MKPPAAIPLVLIGLLAAAPAALSAVAPAEAAPYSKRERTVLKRNCSADAAIFCGDVDPGSPQMKACFKTHMRKLSPGCRRAIGAVMGARRG